jgi:hypothetical protein
MLHEYVLRLFEVPFSADAVTDAQSYTPTHGVDDVDVDGSLRKISRSLAASHQALPQGTLFRAHRIMAEASSDQAREKIK